jgi:hypothetical protein
MKRTAMRRTHFIRGSLLGGAGAALLFLSGCELLVDFDRSKILNDSGLVSFDAGPTGDATVESDAGDGGPSTVSEAAPGDAPSEGSNTTDGAALSEAGLDASHEGGAALDGPLEATLPIESGPATIDSSTPNDGTAAEAAPAEAAAPGTDASDSSAGDDGG